MPRYHFNLQDGEAFVFDEEGMELPDIESAQMEAAEFLSDTVKELTMRRSDTSGHSMAIEVRELGTGSISIELYVFRPLRVHARTIGQRIWVRIRHGSYGA